MEPENLSDFDADIVEQALREVEQKRRLEAQWQTWEAWLFPLADGFVLVARVKQGRRG